MLLKSSLQLLVAGLATAAPASDTLKRGVSFDWGTEKVRGVNIGGWLVLEPWITPSIFEQFSPAEVVDEYTLNQKLGTQRAHDEVLKPHWDSWVTFEDFKRIKDYGFNVVRIPIGYWAYATYGSPYAQGAAPYLDNAIDWARATGLKVFIDLHGAPGSQNGFDNSGQKTSNPLWLTGDTTQQTLEVIQIIADKYAQPMYQDVVVGIQLLNEPLMSNLQGGQDGVRQYYRDGYGNVRTVSDTPVILHDGFQQPPTWNGFLTPSDNNAQGVVMDHHEYQVFNFEQIAWDPPAHRQHVCNNIDTINGADKWTFVGEWTGAMTDCAKYLNGYGVGARYDGSYPESTYKGSCADFNDLNNWDQQLKDDTRMYIEAQLDAFEAKTQGWVWWNFKTEGAAEWDMFRLVEAGIFPNPPTSRKFGPVCNNL
ncbi:glycoside hydrolase [Pseudovirgaria hyperparasitica]|uniref:glucan 1,3-beta-glucosidase n=1 Tax=Pseudovirgaria hyperparasitica TaxID=470096 RepID=A0A6A6W7T1_9PEZI|nr:glycoside hydrolase [Pseudovirgaria hyperparasitica]KAF2758595.1 glycoside hydrolase [Pseudovirgaria hyperparasitica]